MAEIPNTDNVTVAKIAAAYEMSRSEANFKQRLQKFAEAYAAVSKAVETASQEAQ